MDLIYDFPTVDGAEGTPDHPDLLASGTIGDIAPALEQTGWFGLAFTEHPAPPQRWLANGGHQSLDPLIALGHAAAVTTSLRLLSFLVVAPYRNPLLLGKAAATVDVLSGGRLILGIGTGYLKAEFRALGADFEERNALFEEALDVLPRFWTGDPLAYDGRHWSAADAMCSPPSVQQPIPIWIGGNARVTRERVAKKAQGWMPLIAPPSVAPFTRTPAVEGIEDLAVKIAAMKDLAGDRASTLDVLYTYRDEGLMADPTAQQDRHQEAMGQLRDAGVTHTAVHVPKGMSPAQNLDWISAVPEALR